MRVLVTGSEGFVGKNLLAHLGERKDVEVLRYSRKNSIAELPSLLAQADFVFHLAGVNRPLSVDEFKSGNTDLTKALCDSIAELGKPIPVLFSSSIQAELPNPYGSSKLQAEDEIKALAKRSGSPVYLFRLPNVFGKWARPNYNSAVATFCHNIARNIPIQINDAAAKVRLVYIDDVMARFVDVMDGRVNEESFVTVEPEYHATVGEIASLIQSFRNSRNTLISEPVGTGFVRALYSTYVSYLPPESFTYEVPKHADSRGVFVEMLKTHDSGQFSYFTAHPGVTRGGHYHHSKTEKFLVIKGTACFRFRHIHSGEFYELTTSGDVPEIVETVPGWTHDITNVGSEEMLVMLWANEVFDRDRPDTYSNPLD
ncbi:capsular biosynthesis protein [Pseudomonas taiwanensis]|uniref:UDP-2-acetamido-2,6-beta-L-arabino-hexul-4-ose reductase n=1 Tax=Pseudomonas taiwanensis TaxID=470150 RepID=UPI0015B8AA08|nr:capsular polysaccharide biosynthesis protein CapF [Pseudomonas taiwanensis]NWL75595.1 capsular biosynthesis protein [Pseudomonas taiwanensis]